MIHTGRDDAYYGRWFMLWNLMHTMEDDAYYGRCCTLWALMHTIQHDEYFKAVPRNFMNNIMNTDMNQIRQQTNSSKI